MNSNYPVTRALSSVFKWLGILSGIMWMLGGVMGASLASKMGQSGGLMVFAGIVAGVVSCVVGFLIGETIVVLADIGDASREILSILKKNTPTTSPGTK